MAVVRLNQSCPSNNCVSVEKWIHQLRQALPWQNNLNVKIRISKCTEPTRGCGCSDSNGGSTESLERTKGVSSPTRGEWTGGHGIRGSDEGSAESPERPEGDSSPTRGEWTRGNGIAGFDEDSTESLNQSEGFSFPTLGEWTGAHGITAFSRLHLSALLVCLLSILVYLLFSST